MSCAALVPIEECPECGTDLDALVCNVAVEEPIVRGSGYGAARITRRLVCLPPCRWALTVEVSETRPARVVAQVTR